MPKRRCYYCGEMALCLKKKFRFTKDTFTATATSHPCCGKKECEDRFRQAVIQEYQLEADHE